MKVHAYLLVILVVCTTCMCDFSKQEFDLQGHRGCRGLYPENTIPAFLHAIDLGVNTIEMDLAVTKDQELLVSHEPYMSAVICLDTSGISIAGKKQFEYNIYQMSYDQITQFDCGSKPHERFPEQKKMALTKPKLQSVIEAVNEHVQKNGLPSVAYNIEIKSTVDGDNIYHPEPKDFSDLVYSTLDGILPWDLITIQSFDFRVLQYFHSKYPTVGLALLIENRLTFQENLDSLGFTPDIYSCDFKLLSQESVISMQQQGLAIIPWTVNETDDMKRLVGWGVDGLITDYPDKFNLINNE